MSPVDESVGQGDELGRLECLGTNVCGTADRPERSDGTRPVADSGELERVRKGLAAVGEGALDHGANAGQIGGGVYALGLLLLAVGSWRAGKLARWIPGLWLLAIVVAVPAIFAESLQVVSYTLGGVLFGLGFVVAGYWLWSGRSGGSKRK